MSELAVPQPQATITPAPAGSTPAPQQPEMVERVYLDKITAERDELKKKTRELEERDRQRQIAEAKSTEEKERLRLEGEGKLQESFDIERRQWATKWDRAKKKLISDGIKAEASRIPNLVPSAIDDLPRLLDGVDVDEDTMELVDANKKTIREILPSVISSRPHLIFDSMARGTGAKPSQTIAQSFSMEAALADKSGKLMAEWKDRDPDGYKTAEREHFNGQKLRKKAVQRFTQKGTMNPDA